MCIPRVLNINPLVVVACGVSPLFVKNRFLQNVALNNFRCIIVIIYIFGGRERRVCSYCK